MGCISDAGIGWEKPNFSAKWPIGSLWPHSSKHNVSGNWQKNITNYWKTKSHSLHGHTAHLWLCQWIPSIWFSRRSLFKPNRYLFSVRCTEMLALKSQTSPNIQYELVNDYRVYAFFLKDDSNDWSTRQLFAMSSFFFLSFFMGAISHFPVNHFTLN